MKTMKSISILSILLIVAIANAAFSAIPEKPGQREEKSTAVMFRVNVHLHSDLALKGIYQVQLISDDGNLVAPPQIFVAGVNTYYFSKHLSLPGAAWLESGLKTRITARLVLVATRDDGFKPELYTRPDSKSGRFIQGRMYEFNLTPVIINNAKAPGTAGKE